METLLKQFDSFLKRSMLPSSVLIVVILLLTHENLSNYQEYFAKLVDENNIYIVYFLILVSLVAISFIMSILTQIIFDNTMKKNFNAFFFYKHENQLLEKLRAKSIAKLNKESKEFEGIELTDSFLYQVIGRKLQFFKKPTPTTRYIDETKSTGSIAISIMLALFWQLIQECSCLYIFFIIIIYAIARAYILSKYRSRAIRIYTNYIIGNDNKM